MNDLPALLTQALAGGFSHAGELNCSSLKFLPEVRDMCAADRCGSYNKNWTCPPNCGTLAEAATKVSQYHQGILVQSVGQLEDDFDYETMEATAQVHRQRFHDLVHELRKTSPDLLAMGAGACTLCAECTCPAEPCRFPGRAITSMEAYGLFVSQVCTDSGMAYNRGPQTVTYSSCILFKP